MQQLVDWNCLDLQLYVEVYRMNACNCRLGRTHREFQAAAATFTAMQKAASCCADAAFRIFTDGKAPAGAALDLD
jgi:hypothetical protein